jgi:hypothetical protein
VAVLSLANGRSELAEEQFAKARLLDQQNGEARVKTIRAALGLK